MAKARKYVGTRRARTETVGHRHLRSGKSPALLPARKPIRKKQVLRKKTTKNQHEAKKFSIHGNLDISKASSKSKSRGAKKSRRAVRK